MVQQWGTIHGYGGLSVAMGDHPWLWGTIRGYGGPTVVMLRAIDGPPGETIHGYHTWSGGTDCGGNIGSVTEPLQ